LIRDFIERIGQLRPQLITFNGHSFDLPVLRCRAKVNRVPAAGLHVRQYFHRYTEDTLDLCDVLGSYVPGAKVKLDDVSKILRLSRKPAGIDGSRVEEMVLAGQIEEVAQYCESDVPNTYRVCSSTSCFADPLPHKSWIGARHKSATSSPNERRQIRI
jgi:predicted PolB exonuclease-like 3'-5' exonuclease